ncbi:hypothetical protein [Amycolatopsis acidiphila]|uniref:Uncharacterized protein n=2 Tax=Amycolatopsis acidiphila TaxID=715473 RepID=A0A558ACE9_9PSEU|nr:hypothetical protein [Amycolatopsis acidiphila]TVT21948.1 hypothetical protein FNH06_15465 [Amycolatopsis acidiphila]GHG84557.1 hypothetical protein GCM10017788_56700 [Amycolatopsis acidiphila]
MASGIAVFLAVAAVVVVVAVNGRDSKPVAQQPVSSPTSTFSTAPTTSTTTTTTGSTSTAVSTSTSLGFGDVPDGYRRATGPADVEVSIPDSWPVKSGAIESNDQADDPSGSGSFLRYGGSPSPSMSLLDAVRQNEVTNSGIRNGYQRLRLENATTASGDETVAWEFLFTKDGVQRHALGWFWRSGGYDRVVYASSATSSWTDLRPVVDVLIGSAGPL